MFSDKREKMQETVTGQVFVNFDLSDNQCHSYERYKQEVAHVPLFGLVFQVSDPTRSRASFPRNLPGFQAPRKY